jgi:hypothetical protein
MHYQDGKEVKVGDLIRMVGHPEGYKTGPVTEHLGFVAGGTPSSSACNLTVVPVALRVKSPLGTSGWNPVATQLYPSCVNSADCLLVFRDPINETLELNS